jgi:hypothetical protein
MSPLQGSRFLNVILILTHPRILKEGGNIRIDNGYPLSASTLFICWLVSFGLMLLELFVSIRVSLSADRQIRGYVFCPLICTNCH